MIGELNALNFDRDPITFSATEVQFLAVDQHSDTGHYSWTVLETIPLLLPGDVGSRSA